MGVKKDAKIEKETKKDKKKTPVVESLPYRYSLEVHDDEWTWESYSTSEEVPVEEKVEKITVKPEKKEKKGKGKGKEKKAEEEPIFQPPLEVDIFAEIERLKKEALKATQGEEEKPVEEEKPKGKKDKKTTKDTKPKEPKEKKKKLTEKEKAALKEQLRIEAELAAKKAAEEEEQRLIAERNAAIEKDKREPLEQKLREDQLKKSTSLRLAMQEENLKRSKEEKKIREWEQYLKCDGLPDPYVCSQMNTYLHMWQSNLEAMSIEEAFVKTQEVLKLLDALTTFIDDPMGAEDNLIVNWKWIRATFREYQHKSLDSATYKMLRDIDGKMKRVDLCTFNFGKKSDDIAFFLWVELSKPTSKPTTRKITEESQTILELHEISMMVIFPLNFRCQNKAIRVIYVTYDHLSDLCSSFEDPLPPELYRQELSDIVFREFKAKLLYKYECHRQKEDLIPKDILPKSKRMKRLDMSADEIPTVPYEKLEPSASEVIVAEDEDTFLNARKQLHIEVAEHVLNLRNHMIIGGTYFFNLYYQPPQPRDLVIFHTRITKLTFPNCLDEVTMHIKYDGPPPIDLTVQRDPKELALAKLERKTALEKLIFINIPIPKSVVWFNDPVVCFWDNRKKEWMLNDIHELFVDRNKNYISFYTGTVGNFSLATFRYTNFPFQHWELVPENNGTVTYKLVTALLTFEFNIKENLVALADIVGLEKTLKSKFIGTYQKLPKLIKHLRETGIEIFAAFDAFCYVEGTCEKHWPMERHLYYNIAQLCICFNFLWSRWNFKAGRRNAVFLMREFTSSRCKRLPFFTVLVTPLRALYTTCTEDSEEYTDNSVEGMKLYSDLFHLMRSTNGMPIKTKIQNANASMVTTVAELLMATRMLSFS